MWYFHILKGYLKAVIVNNLNFFGGWGSNQLKPDIL